MAEGWSNMSANMIRFHWASSTLKQYNSHLQRFYQYCVLNEFEYPPAPPVIAGYMCMIAEGSDKPRSIIKCVSSAISHLYEVYGLFHVMAQVLYVCYVML